MNLEKITTILNNNEGILAVIGLFLTAGIAVVGWIILDKKGKGKTRQEQKVRGDKNKSFQAGRDIKINVNKEVKTPQKKKSSAQNGFKLVRGKPDQMKIEGVLWEWCWRKNSDRKDRVLDILDLKPLCPKHKYELEYKLEQDDVLALNWPVALYCRECNSIIKDNLDTFDGCGSIPEFEDRIRRLIIARSRQTGNDE